MNYTHTALECFGTHSHRGLKHNAAMNETEEEKSSESSTEPNEVNLKVCRQIHVIFHVNFHCGLIKFASHAHRRRLYLSLTSSVQDNTL